jgi:hypothetical protein
MPILRAVGDRPGEATTLSNIGMVYDSLGEKQKALDYFNQALPIQRAVGDRSEEASSAYTRRQGSQYNDSHLETLSLYAAWRRFAGSTPQTDKLPLPRRSQEGLPGGTSASLKLRASFLGLQLIKQVKAGVEFRHVQYLDLSLPPICLGRWNSESRCDQRAAEKPADH